MDALRCTQDSNTTWCSSPEQGLRLAGSHKPAFVRTSKHRPRTGLLFSKGHMLRHDERAKSDGASALRLEVYPNGAACRVTRRTCFQYAGSAERKLPKEYACCPFVNSVEVRQMQLQKPAPPAGDPWERPMFAWLRLRRCGRLWKLVTSKQKRGQLREER